MYNMQILLTFSLLLVLVVAKNQNYTCLTNFAKSVTCSNEIQNSLPVNRYSCKNLYYMAKCHERAVELGCWEGAMSSDMFIEREKAVVRILYPNQKCKFMEPDPTATLHQDSRMSLICSAEEELKMNMLLDGCSGFVISNSSDLMDFPCHALEKYLDTCVERFVPRYI
jgi:hypothetical protein